MPEQENYSGMAALSICEALLLALNDRNILPESEIVGILRDAAVTHENAVGPETEMNRHRSAAALIDRIIERRNALRKQP